MTFLFLVEVFFTSAGTCMYCMHLYDKFKELISLEHFFKHSSFGNILTLLFACSYISYVVEQKSLYKEP